MAVYRCFMDESEKEKVLDDLHAFSFRGRSTKRELDRRAILNWYIDLSRQESDLTKKPDAQIQVLRDQYRALQETLMDFSESEASVTLHALLRFQASIRKHLAELADTGRTDWGGAFTLRATTLRNPTPQRSHDPALLWNESVEPYNGKGLLFELYKLLREVKPDVLRCPYCTNVFIQPRRDAQYCSRRCQTNYYANNPPKKSQKGRTIRKGK